MAMGHTASEDVNTMDYVTIASTGNATDFGDMTPARDTAAAASNSISLMASGGQYAAVADTNVVKIATLGNASDYGDLTTATRSWAGCCGSHGGI
jgi:hypothetical protein